VNEVIRKATGIALAAIIATLGAGAAHSQAAPETTGDVFNIPADIKILAKQELRSRKATAIVNGTLITGTDVDQRVALVIAASNAGEVPAEEIARLRLQILRNLIDETLQIQEAKAQEIEVTDDEIQETYLRLATDRFSRSVEALDKYLVQIGSSPQSLKRQIQGELAWDRLMRRNVAPFVNISAGEVSELFQRLQESKGSAEYRIGEIFLSATPANREAVAENAKRMVDQLRQGQSFVAFARQYSEASTAAVGGDLGWIKLEQLQNPQLETVARELQPGQLVGPIEIPGGFSILYLIDRRQVGMADPRDTVMSLKQISLDFPATTPEAEARAKAQAFTEAVQRMRGCGDAENVASQVGAQVVTNDQMRIRDLPEALQAVLLKLTVGEATPPFGALNEGVRVLMVCGRDDPKVESGPNIEQLTAQLEDDRVQKRAQRYLRDLRRDAVIDYN
jgi:peptidyl-prolyl cis-trans isomerase SurA